MAVVYSKGIGKDTVLMTLSVEGFDIWRWWVLLLLFLFIVIIFWGWSILGWLVCGRSFNSILAVVIQCVVVLCLYYR